MYFCNSTVIKDVQMKYFSTKPDCVVHDLPVFNNVLYQQHFTMHLKQ